MTFSNNFYVGEKIKNPEELIEKLNRGKVKRPFYLVVFDKESGKMEVLFSFLFLQKYYRSKDYEVCALFKSEDEAFEYIRVIAQLSYERFDDFEPYKVANTIGLTEVKKIFGMEEIK